jgi:hypothetical protein
MSDCRYETRVAEAVRTDRWTGVLREHCQGCAACAESALVAAALTADAARDDDPVPDVGRVWLIARQESRHHAAQRAMWPITVAYRVAWMAVAAVAIAWAPQLIDLLGGGVSALLPPDTSSTILQATTSPVAVMVATALFLAGLVAVEAAVRDSR